MTLYQRILEAIKERPQTMQDLVQLLKAPILSVKSALRDLRKYRFITGQKNGKVTTYRVTKTAETFTHIPNRPRREKKLTTVQIAVRSVPNSVFALGAM